MRNQICQHGWKGDKSMFFILKMAEKRGQYSYDYFNIYNLMLKGFPDQHFILNLWILATLICML